MAVRIYTRMPAKKIALRPLLWEVCCDAYTHFKTNYKAAHEGRSFFGVDSNSTRLSEARVEGARSALSCETGSSDPIHHIDTHTQTYKFESP